MMASAGEVQYKFTVVLLSCLCLVLFFVLLFDFAVPKTSNLNTVVGLSVVLTQCLC